MFHLGLFTTHLPYILILVFYAVTFLLPDKNQEDDRISDCEKPGVRHFNNEDCLPEMINCCSFYSEKDKSNQHHINTGFASDFSLSYPVIKPGTFHHQLPPPNRKKQRSGYFQNRPPPAYNMVS